MKFSRRKLLIGGASALAFGAAGYKLLRGFDDDPNESSANAIPERLRNTALDVHVHVMGVGTGGTGCWMHDEMQSSIQARAGLWNLRLSLSQPDLDQAYVAYLLSRIERAGFLKQVVVLAQDYTHTERGERDTAHTPFYTPNDYVARLAREHPERFLFGASIHPYRPDALDELDRVAAMGALVVKWIPNVQVIDLTDPRCRAFYRRMAQHKIALLPHVGDEQVLSITWRQQYGDPRGLVTALEEGVTVIAAHVASLGEREGRRNFDWLAEMLREWPNLYADTSALTLFTRWRVLLELTERDDLHAKLVHGSDFPLPPAATLFFGRVPAGRWWNAWKRENIFRRDFEIKRALGMPDAMYARGYEVLVPRIAAARA